MNDAGPNPLKWRETILDMGEVRDLLKAATDRVELVRNGVRCLVIGCSRDLTAWTPRVTFSFMQVLPVVEAA
jgi:hypothetical protein